MMKRLSCFVTHVVCVLAMVCTHLPAHTQTVKDTSTNWSAWMEKGKHQKLLHIHGETICKNATILLKFTLQGFIFQMI